MRGEGGSSKSHYSGPGYQAPDIAGIDAFAEVAVGAAQAKCAPILLTPHGIGGVVVFRCLYNHCTRGLSVEMRNIADGYHSSTYGCMQSCGYEGGIVGNLLSAFHVFPDAHARNRRRAYVLGKHYGGCDRQRQECRVGRRFLVRGGMYAADAETMLACLWHGGCSL